MSTVLTGFFQVFLRFFARIFPLQTSPLLAALLRCATSFVPPKFAPFNANSEVVRQFALKNALMSGTYSYYTMDNKKMSNNLQRENIDIFSITTLDNISIGNSCVIESCSLPSSLRLRLEEMGLTKGAQVTVMKTAPLGDPMEIRVRGYALCIRNDLAKQYVVTKK